METAVTYHPITGVPAEYNDYLPPDSVEYKQWKASLEEGGGEQSQGAVAETSEVEKKLPGNKGPKPKSSREVILETTTRNKKKSITSIYGLEGYGVKLSEAAKACGKKFASGSSVNKSASGRDRIDIQGDVTYELPEFLVGLYGDRGLKKHDVFQIINKKKTRVFDSDED